MAGNYTDPDALGRYLGVALTADQAALVASVLAPAATEAVDAYTGRSWQGTAITGERVPVYGDRAWLAHPPVSALSLTWRALAPGSTVTTGASGTDYELVDAATGLVTFTGWWHGSQPEYVLANYTSTSDAPAAVQLAATMLAAGWLDSPSSVGAAGPLTMRREGDIQEQYAAPAADARGDALPDAVRRLLAPYRVVVVA